MPKSEVGRRRSSNSVTVHDVARLAGVSIITVSRAFNQPDKLSPETLEKVRVAVTKTGYVPNLAAGGLRSSRTRLVAVLVPSLLGHFLDMVQALTGALAPKGYQVVLGQIGYSAEQEDEMLRALIGRRPDGIVITGVVHSAQARRLLIESGIPVVETGDLTPTPIDMVVGWSQEEMAYEACTYLAKRGRKRLAVVSGDDSRAIRRKESFLRVAQSLGLAAPAVHMAPSPTSHATGRAALSALLAQHPEVDAIWCSSDILALGVLTEAQVRGIAVPHTLAVMGTGNLDLGATLSPSLTSVQIDRACLGETAARFIIERGEGREVTDKVVDIGFSIVKRESA